MTSERKGPVSWRKGWTITAVFATAYCATLLTAAFFASGVKQVDSSAETASLPLLRQSIRDAQSWLASWAPLRDMPKEERLALLYEENHWKNSLVMWTLPESVQQAMPHFVQTWYRCAVLCAAVYFLVGAVWCYYIYHCFGDVLFKPGQIPGLADTWEQIKVSTLAIPLYSLLPTLTEWAAEKGWTMAYPRIENVGLPMYILYFVMYMSSVEFGVYWMHRGLHEIKWAYRLLHHIHHKYNKEHTLSPFAGLAFHPLDGILQAVPYTWTMFFCPMHFMTHEILLFATGVWTANIHDNIHGKVWPIMGAKYHTIHHTDYKSNYGHYFVFMDHLFGTMLTPEEEEERERQRNNMAATPARKAAPRAQAAEPAPAIDASQATAQAVITTASKGSGVVTRSRAKTSTLVQQ